MNGFFGQVTIEPSVFTADCADNAADTTDCISLVPETPSWGAIKLEQNMCLKLSCSSHTGSDDQEDGMKHEKAKTSPPAEEAGLDDDDLRSGGDKLPIVYRPEYGVEFCGLQRLHPFDAAKGGNIYRLLKAGNLIGSDSEVHRPREISVDELLDVHTKRYIESLKWSVNVAKIAEIPPLIFVPNYFVQRSYLRPMRYQTFGSILAAKCALSGSAGTGWAINLGGGFHHCSGDSGGGFCPYADITLIVRMLQSSGRGVDRIMIVDLDAHQGNGYARDLMDDNGVFIMDMYNYRIYSRDHEAKLAIKRAVELKPHVGDEEYLRKLRTNLALSFDEFRPNFLIYNAGTDVLKGDPLGILDITGPGVIERDEIVFEMARERGVPLVMLLSGGYLRSSARVIADSILNLHAKKLLPVAK